MIRMDDLENVLDELSAQSHTTKMWLNIIIKPTFLMMMFTANTPEYNGYSTWFCCEAGMSPAPNQYG